MLPSKKPLRTETLINFLILLSLSALFLSFSIHQLVNFDIWWHIRTGQYIVENLTIPRSDIYTYTYPGSRWVDLHWLFQVAVYSIHSLLGANGLIIFQVLILGASFIIISNASTERPPLALCGIFIMYALFVCEERFIVRPEILTLLFMAIYIYCLRRRRHRLLPLIPFLQIIWVNTAGLFVIGLVILYLHLIGEAIQTYFSSERRTVDRNHIKAVLAVALISTAVCFINPFGMEGLAFPQKLVSRIVGQENIYSVTIGEFQPPIFIGPLMDSSLFSRAALTIKAFLSGQGTHSVLFFKILLAISILSLALNIRKLRISSLLIYTAFLYLALSARRNMALFSLAALPFSIENVASFWEHLREKRKLETTCCAIATALIVLTVSWQVPAIISGRYYMEDNITKRFGLGVSPMMYPIMAAEFVKSAPIRGNIFNDLASGGFLIWKLFPERKIFIDGRLEVMPEDFYWTYLNIIDRPEENFSDCAERYNIQMVILSHRAVGKKLLNFLYKSPLWKPVYFDEVGIVFCRNRLENSRFIDEHLVDFSRPGKGEAIQGGFPYGHFYRGNFLMTIGLYGPAYEEYQKGLRLYPAYAPGYNALGRIYDERGEVDRTRSLYSKALAIDPNLFEAHLNLGNLELEKGSPGKAIAHYRRAIALNPFSLDAIINMGTALARAGDIHGAIEQYRKALAIDPNSEAAARNLRIVMDEIRSSPRELRFRE